jgi:hypothetical protein
MDFIIGLSLRFLSAPRYSDRNKTRRSLKTLSDFEIHDFPKDALPTNSVNAA